MGLLKMLAYGVHEAKVIAPNRAFLFPVGISYWNYIRPKINHALLSFH